MVPPGLIAEEVAIFPNIGGWFMTNGEAVEPLPCV
jgi:hypothetical protein